jgi:hypothetical protein
MKVKATQHIEVELSPVEILRVIQRHLVMTCRWKPCQYIGADNKVYLEIDTSTSHSSTMQQYVRDATPEDVAYYSLYRGF